MGYVLSSMTNCIPVISTPEVLTQEYVEHNLQNVINSLDSRIKESNDNAEVHLQSAIRYRRSKNKKSAMVSMRKYKLEQKRAETFENQKINLENQLNGAKDQDLALQAVTALNEHKKIVSKQLGSANVDEVTDLMHTLTEQREMLNEVQIAISSPFVDTTDIDYDYTEDDLMSELDSIAFTYGENVESDITIEVVGEESDHISDPPIPSKRKKEKAKQKRKRKAPVPRKLPIEEILKTTT